jgi:drug/metabolite transporter (DMT)-like permease
MLTILGLVAIVVFTVQVYKTAAGTERNAPLWAAMTAVIGIALQFVVPILFGVVLAVYYIATGTPVENLESEMFGGALLISIAGIVLSIVGMVLAMKHVSKVKDDEPAAKAPPPPPTFDQNI